MDRQKNRKERNRKRRNAQSSSLPSIVYKHIKDKIEERFIETKKHRSRQLMKIIVLSWSGTCGGRFGKASVSGEGDG